MSTGTKIVQNALSNIGAHSVIAPASPESLEVGKDALNSMIARWADEDIDIGAVPLEAIGDELSEPMGLTSAIEYNLSIELHPKFPATQISPQLNASANKTFQDMRSKVQTITIPNPVVRQTLPKGQGNRQSRFINSTFFDKGGTLAD